jgi:plastocyanin
MTHSDRDAARCRTVEAAGGRRAIRPLALATVPVALISLLAACGGSSTSPPAGSSPPAAAGSSSASAPSGSSTSSAAAAAGVLTGVVGESDAYVITLKDGTGAPVTSLKAGSYTVKVKDASKIHNFHLTGAGVDEKTSVADTTEVTWTVTLTPGTYTYTCDPHPKMTGSFTVT